MKTQKQLKELLTKKVEEISLASEPIKGIREPFSKMAASFDEIRNIGKQVKDKKIEAIVNDFYAAEKKLRDHLIANYGGI